jgi:protocatechuate 3,4-dioxygenase alpha subunit
MAHRAPTPGQTAGPFFGYALPYECGPNLIDRSSPTAVRLHGWLYDGGGAPVLDGLIEIWQADEHGTISTSSGSLHRNGYTFTGFGRAETDGSGHYQFTTVEPGRRKDAAGPPFIMVVVFARGLLNKLHTRIYLPQHRHLFAEDPLLASLDPARIPTLVASREADGALRHDIRLQGEGETVFLKYEYG